MVETDRTRQNLKASAGTETNRTSPLEGGNAGVPMSLKDILLLQLESAASDSNPEDKLDSLLQCADRTSHHTYTLLTALSQSEKKCFEEFVNSNHLTCDIETRHLSGYARLSEELVGKFAALVNEASSPPESSTTVPNCAPTLEQVVQLHGEWATLMFDELTSLSKKPEWEEIHLTLIQHACKVLGELFAVPLADDDKNQRSKLIATLEQASLSVLQSNALACIISDEPGLNAAVTVCDIFLLAQSWESDLPGKRVADLLPALHQRLKELSSDRYVTDLDDQDDWPDEEDDSSELDSSLAWQPTEVIPAEYYGAQQLAEEDQRDSQVEEVINVWETAFTLGLEALHRGINWESSADKLLDILYHSPFEMPLRRNVVDALVCVSEIKLRKYLNFLMDKAKNEQFACHELLSIADFSARTNIRRTYNPFQLVKDALTQLNQEDQRAILNNCKKLVDDFHELFDNPQITKGALTNLFNTLENK